MKNDRKETKVIIEEVEKELDGLGIVKAVHRLVFIFLNFWLKILQPFLRALVAILSNGRRSWCLLS